MSGLKRWFKTWNYDNACLRPHFVILGLNHASTIGFLFLYNATNPSSSSSSFFWSYFWEIIVFSHGGFPLLFASNFSLSVVVECSPSLSFLLAQFSPRSSSCSSRSWKVYTHYIFGFFLCLLFLIFREIYVFGYFG